MYKIIDMHSDTISRLLDDQASLNDDNYMVSYNQLLSSNYFIQCFAMFVFYRNNKIDNYSPFSRCEKMIDKYIEETTRYNIKPILCQNDLKDNALSSLLTIEEGGVLEGKLSNLDYFYNRGVRMLCLTWNYENELGYPNIDRSKDLKIDDFYALTANNKDGLKPFGKQVVKRMNELGMVIDCSHSSDKTFYDVINLTTKPIVCSHSCARGVCNCVRNMSDDMLLKLKENGGVVGINFCHDFVKKDESIASIDDVIKHIDYIKKIIGIDYIGLGSDFDGISNSNIEIKNASLMPALLNRLSEHGYSDEEIEKIAYKNVQRVLLANLK